MEKFVSRVEILVTHYAEDAENAYLQGNSLRERAVEAMKDGVLAPTIKPGLHWVYEGDPFNEPEKPHRGPVLRL